MNLTLVRFEFTDKSTIGKLAVNGVFECYMLEDTCREAEPGSWHKALKVFGETAIPYGRYRVVISMSDRFKKPLPEILNVPDYSGVRIHNGNKPVDTEGCLLPGQTRDRDWVGNSGAAFGPIFRKIESALLRSEKVWLDIIKNDPSLSLDCVW